MYLCNASKRQNIVDPDKATPLDQSSLTWVTLFVQTCLSKNLASLP